MHLLESISASAGSGKTFALALRYIALLSLGANSNSILALTFTKKAAREMKERIEHLLDTLSTNDADIQKNLLDAGGKIVDFSRLKKEFILGEDRIVTIDSFFSTILRKFCFYAGVRGDFEVSSSKEDEFVEFFLNSLSKDRVEHIAAFCHHQNISLDRFLEVLDEFELDRNIVYEKVDFTHIINIENRVMDILSELNSAVSQYEKASPSALKTFEFSSFEEFGQKLKSTPAWLLKESLCEYSYFKKLTGIEKNDNLVEEMKTLLKEHYRLKELYEIHTLMSFYEEYKEIKLQFIKKKNSLSFGEVEELLELLLSSKGIDRDFLYFRLDGEIEHILIDEFQDTNLSQYKLLLPLIEEIKSGIGRKDFRSFFIVGDKKQSIYRFRGANPYLFDLAASRLHKSYLQINRRSSKNIIDFVNRVFESKIENYLPQKSLYDEARGYLKIRSGSDIEDELFLEIEKLLEAGVNPSDIAILSFKNDDLDKLSSSLYERFLQKVEFETDLSSKLINAKEVRAIISALKQLYKEDRLYKEEFKSLIGEDLKVQRGEKTPLTYILEIIKSHSLFSYNTIRFAEIASKYDDVETLLDELETIDDSIIGNPKEGILLQTIHKSKGLDYRYVLVVDSLGGEKSSSKNINLIYDKTKLVDIKIRLKGRELFDKNYEEFLEKEKKKDIDDKLNTLYVAFTRAKDGLSIIKKDEHSRFDLLELDEVEVGSITPSPTTVVDDKISFRYEFLEKVLGAQKDYNKELQTYEDNYRSIYRGLALHLMFENSKGVDIGDDTKNLTYALYGLYVDDIEQISKDIEDFKASDLAKKISGADIYTEVSLYSKNITGRIDMLAVFKDRAYIIDFKSGGDSKEYQKQLERYKKGVEDILKREVYTELYFVKERRDGLF